MTLVSICDTPVTDGIAFCVADIDRFTDSDGFLSDGGELYKGDFERPAAPIRTIPIIKPEKVSNHDVCKQEDQCLLTSCFACLAVTGSCSVGECGRLSQPVWLLGAL